MNTIIDEINAIIKAYNVTDWTTTNVDNLLKGQKKLSYQKFLLGNKLGKAKADFIRAELAYKNKTALVELELSEEHSNNQSQIIAKRDDRVLQARKRTYECKAMAEIGKGVFDSVDSTLMSMSQLIKYLMNEKAYSSHPGA